MKKFALSIFFILSCSFAYGGIVMPSYSDHGKITSIHWAAYFEAGKTAQIIGELTEILSDELNNGKKIYLSFDYNAYDSVKTAKYNISLSPRPPYRGKRQYIYISCSGTDTYDATKMLKLAEYAMGSRRHMMASMRDTVIYSERAGEHYTYTQIESSVLDSVLNAPISPLVQKVLSNKIYRPGNLGKEYISYYWQNNKYHIYKTHRNFKKEVVAMELEHIYQFSEAGDQGVVVFDTPRSFYFVRYNHSIGGGNGINHNILSGKVSARHILDKRGDGRRPFEQFEVSPIGKNMVCISEYYYPSEEEHYSEYFNYFNPPTVSFATDTVIYYSSFKPKPLYFTPITYSMIYLTDRDILLQDAETIIRNAAVEQDKKKKDNFFRSDDVYPRPDSTRRDYTIKYKYSSW